MKKIVKLLIAGFIMVGIRDVMPAIFRSVNADTYSTNFPCGDREKPNSAEGCNAMPTSVYKKFFSESPQFYLSCQEAANDYRPYYGPDNKKVEATTTPGEITLQEGANGMVEPSAQDIQVAKTTCKRVMAGKERPEW